MAMVIYCIVVFAENRFGVGPVSNTLFYRRQEGSELASYKLYLKTRVPVLFHSWITAVQMMYQSKFVAISDVLMSFLQITPLVAWHFTTSFRCKCVEFFPPHILCRDHTAETFYKPPLKLEVDP